MWSSLNVTVDTGRTELGSCGAPSQLSESAESRWAERLRHAGGLFLTFCLTPLAAVVTFDEPHPSTAMFWAP